MAARRQPLRFRHLRRRRIVGRELPIATSGLSRLLGLALLARDRAPDGLLIPRCRGVHTFGMRFPIHVVFLDRRSVPVSVRGAVPPNRMLREPRAAAVVELPASGGRTP